MNKPYEIEIDDPRIKSAFEKHCPFVRLLFDAGLVLPIHAKEAGSVPMRLFAPDESPQVMLPFIYASIEDENVSEAAVAMCQRVEKLALGIVGDWGIIGPLNHPDVKRYRSFAQARQALKRSMYFGPYLSFTHDGHAICFNATNDVIRMVVALTPRVHGDKVICVIVPQIRKSINGDVGIAVVEPTQL